MWRQLKRLVGHVSFEARQEEAGEEVSDIANLVPGIHADSESDLCLAHHRLPIPSLFLSLSFQSHQHYYNCR